MVYHDFWSACSRGSSFGCSSSDSSNILPLRAVRLRAPQYNVFDLAGIELGRLAQHVLDAVCGKVAGTGQFESSPMRCSRP
jgi:hypothetical protein